MARTSNITAEDILRDHSPEVRQIVGVLQKLITDTLDGLTEKAYPGWHAIGFRHPRAGYICGIFPYETTVRLIFEKGVLLSDPHGVLEGDTKQIRFIEITDAGQVPDDAVRRGRGLVR